MSTEDLRRLLMELGKIYHPNCDGREILDMIPKKVCQFEESDMKAIRDQIKLLRESINTKSGLLNEIERRLNINQEKKFYKDALKECKAKNMGVSLLDDEWNFGISYQQLVVIDEKSKKILEIRKQRNPNFYQLLAKFSQDTTNDFYLQDSIHPQVFNFSIKSKNNRKNAARQFAKKNLKSDKMENKIKDKFKAKLLHTIYFKSIETTMQRYSIYVDDQFQIGLKQLNLKSTHKLKHGWQEVVLVYFKEVHYKNNYTLQQLSQDSMVTGYQGLKIRANQANKQSKKTHSQSTDGDDPGPNKNVQENENSDIQFLDLYESHYTYTPDHIL